MGVFGVFFDGLGIFLIVYGSLEREIVEIQSILRWMGGFLMVCGVFFDGFGMLFGVFYRVSVVFDVFFDGWEAFWRFLTSFLMAGRSFWSGFREFGM